MEILKLGSISNRIAFRWEIHFKLKINVLQKHIPSLRNISRFGVVLSKELWNLLCFKRESLAQIGIEYYLSGGCVQNFMKNPSNEIRDKSWALFLLHVANHHHRLRRRLFWGSSIETNESWTLLSQAHFIDSGKQDKGLLRLRLSEREWERISDRKNTLLSNTLRAMAHFLKIIYQTNSPRF